MNYQTAAEESLRRTFPTVSSDAISAGAVLLVNAMSAVDADPKQLDAATAKIAEIFAKETIR